MKKMDIKRISDFKKEKIFEQDLNIILKKGIVSFIGNKIREYREIFGYTQEELAKLVDITPAYLGNIERGERETSTRLLEKIAAIFDIDTFNFFTTKKENLSSKEILIKKIIGILKNNSYEKNKKIYKLLLNLNKL